MSEFEEFDGMYGPDKKEEPTPGASVTVEDLDTLVTTIFDQKVEIAEHKLKGVEKTKKLQELEGKAVAYLKELHRKKYVAQRGTIYIQAKWRINLPQSEADKKLLFAHLKERGLADKYMTVNSISLNSLFMADWEAAKKQGAGMDFEMPGIAEPKLFEALGSRKK